MPVPCCVPCPAAWKVKVNPVKENRVFLKKICRFTLWVEIVARRFRNRTYCCIVNEHKSFCHNWGRTYI